MSDETATLTLMYRLADASLNVRTDDVVLRYVTSGQQPTEGTMLLSTFVTSEESDVIRQLGFKLLDNRLVAAFSFNHNDMWQKNYSVTPSRTGDEWTIVFPLNALDGVTSGSWRATLNVAGDDVNSIEGTVASAAR